MKQKMGKLMLAVVIGIGSLLGFSSQAFATDQYFTTNVSGISLYVDATNYNRGSCTVEMDMHSQYYYYDWAAAIQKYENGEWRSKAYASGYVSPSSPSHRTFDIRFIDPGDQYGTYRLMVYFDGTTSKWAATENFYINFSEDKYSGYWERMCY